MHHWNLPNGLTVLYRQDAEFPLVSATLLFKEGSRQERPQEAGLCSMTIDLLMQGTKRKNARQIARVTEAVGASMGTQAHEDYAEMGFVVPAQELHGVLELMAEVLMEPSFPKEEIQKEKAHVLANLASRKDAIFNLAYDHLNECLYGDHAYGRPLEGCKRSVEKFARRDFQRWHFQFLQPDESVLSLIGPLPPRHVLHLVERYFRRWPSHRHPAPLLGKLGGAGRTQKVVVPSKFEQAYLMVGYPAPPMSHEDHVSLKVLNTVMGGGMSSRLFVTLRENLGLAYEVSSFYPSRLERSQWVFYLGLPGEKLKIASEKLSELLNNLTKRAPTPEEVNQAKAMIRGAFLMDRQSRRRQAWYSAWWEFLGRSDQYAEEFLKEIDAVTPQALHDLAKRILSEPRVTVTVVPR